MWFLAATRIFPTNKTPLFVLIPNPKRRFHQFRTADLGVKLACMGCDLVPPIQAPGIRYFKTEGGTQTGRKSHITARVPCQVPSPVYHLLQLRHVRAQASSTQRKYQEQVVVERLGAWLLRV